MTGAQSVISNEPLRLFGGGAGGWVLALPWLLFFTVSIRDLIFLWLILVSVSVYCAIG